jgi:hypothetical protein
MRYIKSAVVSIARTSLQCLDAVKSPVAQLSFQITLNSDLNCLHLYFISSLILRYTLEWAAEQFPIYALKPGPKMLSLVPGRLISTSD